MSPDTYVERHHIMPKSLGGSNNKSNLINLTAREHFVCHWLLTKMVEYKPHKWKMYNALSCMLWRENKNQERYKINSRTYEQLKKNHSELKSWALSGEGNGMYGKNHSDESRVKMRISQAIRWKENDLSDETREKLRNSRKHVGPNLKLRGKNNANYKPGAREKMKATFLERYGVEHGSLIPKTCEHCGKTCGIANYNRWHGDRCKQKLDK